LATARLRADSNVEKYRRLLGYYEQEGLEQADIIRRTATMQMEAGEIDFFQYIQSMQRYSQTRLQFLETVREYNLAVIESQFYTNNEF
jgi:cobalt-zinc-cadmium resistance protein CzcA